MSIVQSDFGHIEIREDFLGGSDGGPAGTNVPAALGGRVGLVGLAGVNEGVVEPVTDEANGVIRVITDTGDDDNQVLWAGTFRPSDGYLMLETRCKIVSTVATLPAVFIGFAETLAKDTPVMPAEHATATMTYNSASVVGLQYDADSTTKAWRAAAKNATNVVSTTTHGTLASPSATPVIDVYDIVRVEIFPEGTWTVSLNGSVVDKSVTVNSLDSAKFYHAVVMVENRTAALVNFEVDYVWVTAGRDWEAT